MGTAIKHPVPYRVKPSSVSFDGLTLSGNSGHQRVNVLHNNAYIHRASIQNLSMTGMTSSVRVIVLETFAHND